MHYKYIYKNNSFTYLIHSMNKTIWKIFYFHTGSNMEIMIGNIPHGLHNILTNKVYKQPTWKICIGQFLEFRKYLAHDWWAVEGWVDDWLQNLINIFLKKKTWTLDTLPSNTITFLLIAGFKQGDIYTPTQQFHKRCHTLNTHAHNSHS